MSDARRRRYASISFLRYDIQDDPTTRCFAMTATVELIAAPITTPHDQSTRADSDRNQLRRSVSSIQFSIKLAVATSLCSSQTVWANRRYWVRRFRKTTQNSKPTHQKTEVALRCKLLVRPTRHATVDVDLRSKALSIRNITLIPMNYLNRNTMHTSLSRYHPTIVVALPSCRRYFSPQVSCRKSGLRNSPWAVPSPTLAWHRTDLELRHGSWER
jgi:hypothetical protein